MTLPCEPLCFLSSIAQPSSPYILVRNHVLICPSQFLLSYLLTVVSTPLLLIRLFSSPLAVPKIHSQIYHYTSVLPCFHCLSSPLPLFSFFAITPVEPATASNNHLTPTASGSNFLDFMVSRSNSVCGHKISNPCPSETQPVVSVIFLSLSLQSFLFL